MLPREFDGEKEGDEEGGNEDRLEKEAELLDEEEDTL